MGEVTGAVTNQYVTVRTIGFGKTHKTFFVNVIYYNGEESVFGIHKYVHKRSARRAAIALAKKLDASYRQDLEYFDMPHAFTVLETV